MAYLGLQGGGLLCDPYFCTLGPLSQGQSLPGTQATSLRGLLSEDLLGARQLMPVPEDTATLEHMHAQPFFLLLALEQCVSRCPPGTMRGFSPASVAFPSDPTRRHTCSVPALTECLLSSPPVPLPACSSLTWQM